jgi:hypothetical protein
MRQAWKRFRAGTVRNLFLLLLILPTLAADRAAELAGDLFAEGQWQACLCECRRASLAEPTNAAPRVLGALAALRLGHNSATALAQLERLAGAATNEMTTLAAYELGRARWRQGDATNACRWTQFAFRHTARPELFARSGCLLAEITRQFPSLGNKDPQLFQTLETCRPLWMPDIVREVLAAPPASAAAGSLPVRWITALYRTQIRPAIGSRCSLTPSCSEYFLQAGRKHGLLAFPLMGDRLVREPGVVAEAEHPVLDGEHFRYADPLVDHDHWLEAKGTH